MFSVGDVSFSWVTTFSAGLRLVAEYQIRNDDEDDRMSALRVEILYFRNITSAFGTRVFKISFTK